MLNAYDPDAYKGLDDPIGIWSHIARRQADKDRILIPSLSRYFSPGSVLELGAGVGQLSILIRNHGYRVTASDYHQFFVDHMRSIGLDAYRVDALDIAAAGLGRFDNIFSQSISPLTTRDSDIVERAYQSMHDALAPRGRIVMIHAMCNWAEVHSEMQRHLRIARRCGLRQVRTFRNQLLPSRAYGVLPSTLSRGLETVLGPRLGIRFVLVAEHGG